MKAVRLVILISMQLFLSTAYASDGSGAHGGDLVEHIFFKGKNQAARMMELLSDEAIKTVFRPEAAKWFLENRENLSADLRKSKLEWRETGSRCAETALKPGSTIFLSYNLCRTNVVSPEQAGELLLHEAVHHFGIADEAFAQEVAVSAYMSFAALKNLDNLSVERDTRPETVDKSEANSSAPKPDITAAVRRTSYETYHPMKFLPFGSGQFYNDRPALGTILAISQLVAAHWWYTHKQEVDKARSKEKRIRNSDELTEDQREDFSKDTNHYIKEERSKERVGLTLFSGLWIAGSLQAINDTGSAQFTPSVTVIDGNLAPEMLLTFKW